jgi:hypothetical protein
VINVRSIIVLILIVGCLGCAPRGEPKSPPAAQTAEASASVKALGAVAGTDAKAVAPDPLTIAAGTLSIAASLKSLFSGDDADIRSLKRKLDAVRAENQVTHDLLRQVLGILKSLGVTVREAVKEENIVLMQAQLQSEITQFYETYDAELVDRRARPDAKRRYETEIIGDVQNISTTLMQPAYGFGAANTVGHGMVLDLWMARRIGWQRNLIGNRAKTYRGYFEQALDEKVADSPAAKLAEARARRERLQAVLIEADRIVGTTGWSKVTRTFKDGRSDRGCWLSFTVTITETASGNQAKGYSGSTSRVDSGLYRDCDTANPRCSHCERLSTEKSATDPTRPQSETPVVMAEYWNAVLASRRAAEADIEVLTKINDGLKEYLSFAQRVERRP